MLRSPPRPTLGWGRPIAAVLAGVIVPAIPAWAGPLSLVGISVGLGLPIAHIFLNGDLTTEAPEMIPFLVTAL